MTGFTREPVDTPPLAQRVEAEQLRGILLLIPSSASSTAAVATVIAMIFWDQVGHAPLLAALALVYAALLLLFVLYWLYRRADVTALTFAPWARANVGVMAFHGCAWGAFGACAFVPGSFAYQGFDLSAIFTVCAATTIGVAPHFRSFVVFVVPTLTPVIVRCLLELTPDSLALAAAGLIGLAYLILAGRHAQHVSEEATRVRFENVELLARLQQEKEGAVRARAEAEASDRAKSRFLAAASHDLRQPLHALGLFVAAARGARSESERARIDGHIEAAVGSLTSLFDALLDISRLDAGVQQPRRRALRVAPVLRRIAAEYAPLARDKGLRFRVRCADLVVCTDPMLFEQMLRNLVTNAVRYTESGGILLSARRRGASARVEVWDTGIGIPTEQQTLVFEEFYQVGNPERDRRKGVGLGLAIVKRAALLLQHRLHLASRPGRGSRFSIEAQLDTSNEDIGRDAPLAARDDDTLLLGAVIVLVDDEADILAAAQTLLRQWGCMVVAAETLEQACAMLQARELVPDVLVSDFRLRGDANGIDVIHTLRARYGAGIPALLLSGDTAADRLRAAKTSALPLLHKPLRADPLKAALMRALAHAPAAAPEG